MIIPVSSSSFWGRTYHSCPTFRQPPDPNRNKNKRTENENAPPPEALHALTSLILRERPVGDLQGCTRHEDGSVQFFPQPLPPEVFARLVVVKPEGLVPLPGDYALEKVRNIRRSAKERVFVTNALRALRQVSPTGNIRDIPFVVLVGGSSLDFEIPQLVTDALSHYKLVAGRGNIRASEGPRNAVATGLILAYQRENHG